MKSDMHEQMNHVCVEQYSRFLPTLIVMFSFPAEAEKAVEEKDKDKEKRKETSTAAEAADPKDKTEAADLKKGMSHLCLWRCATINAYSKFSCF